MKKFLLLIVCLSLLIMTGCQKEEDNHELGEDISDLTTLSYYQYLDPSNPVITITVKDFGVMEAQLFPSLVPNTVNNFIDYILNNRFENNEFHRIIEDFMIQGGDLIEANPPIKGDFASNGVPNPLLHEKGVLSMARTKMPNSATSQFFIMHKKSPHLDKSYASFGGLISGFNVLDLIATTPTNYNDAPLTKVVIENITIELNGYEPGIIEYMK